MFRALALRQSESNYPCTLSTQLINPKFCIINYDSFQCSLLKLVARLVLDEFLVKPLLTESSRKQACEYQKVIWDNRDNCNILRGECFLSLAHILMAQLNGYGQLQTGTDGKCLFRTYAPMFACDACCKT